MSKSLKDCGVKLSRKQTIFGVNRRIRRALRSRRYSLALTLSESWGRRMNARAFLNCN